MSAAGPEPRPPLRIAPIEAPTLRSVRPLPPDPGTAPEPYRVLFPLGAACGIAGALPWVARAILPGAWPGELHAALMVEGFELAFVCGFLLTAMPAFTHGAKCGRGELALATLGVAAFTALHAFALDAAAPAAFALTVAFVLFTLARRVRGGAAAPPEEFALVGLGLVLGMAGGVLQSLAEAGLVPEPSPRFGLRLVSRGMVLCLVLGLGGLLVPTFAGVRDPLAIPGIARAGERPPRRVFIAALAALLLAALAAEAWGHDRAGAWLRLAAGAASTLLSWKLWRLPPRGGRLAWTLWGAGALVLAGLAAAALVPAHEIAAWHVVFVGGYGLLTLAIGTRVVCSHGGHGVAFESRLASLPALGGLALALLARLAGGEADPLRLPELAVAGAGWTIAWLLWLTRAVPLVLRPRPRPPAMVSGPH